MTSPVEFNAAKVVREYYASAERKRSAEKSSDRAAPQALHEVEKAGLGQNKSRSKFLPSGEINPEWKRHPSGKYQKKYLEDGSLNPKWKPRPSVSKNTLVTANEKFTARAGSLILREPVARTARMLNRVTTSPLRRYALWLFRLMLEADKKAPLLSPADTPSLFKLAEQLICPNCGKRSNNTNLFCSELCQQEAITIRYCRRVSRDEQKCLKHDIQEGIGIRLMMLLGGGYPANARKLPQALREQILERDSFACRICGEAATQIDHIDTSSKDPGKRLKSTTSNDAKSATDSNHKTATHPDKNPPVRRVRIPVLMTSKSGVVITGTGDHDYSQ